AEIVDISVLERDNRTVQISINGFSIVDGERWIALQAVKDPSDNMLYVHWSVTGQKLNITNGRLAGVLEARDQLVKGYLDDIDLLAKTVIDRFNEQHEKGYTLDSTLQTGITFFTGTGAKDIAVDNNILQNLALIAASGTARPATGPTRWRFPGFSTSR